MRPVLASLLFSPLLLAGCGGGGSSAPSRSPDQEAALRAVESVAEVNRKGSKGPVRPDRTRLVRHGAARSEDEATYDENLRLWTTVETDGNRETTHYWLDRRTIRPAGTKVVTYPDEGTDDPKTTVFEETITDGPNKGFHRTGSQTDIGPGSWTSTSEASLADGSVRKSFQSLDEDGTMTWSMDDTSGSGLHSKLFLVQHRDGSERRSQENDDFLASADRNADGEVTGKVVAQKPARSATFEGATDGTVTVHYADGASETFAPAR